MNKKKMPIIAIAAVIILVILLIIIFGGKTNRVIKKEEAQTKALPYLYLYFMSDISTGFMNITLDDSCLQNIVTGKPYEESNQGEFKAIELQNNIDYIEYYNFLMSASYNKGKKILTVTLENTDKTQKYSQQYKLDAEDGHITYQKYGDPIYDTFDFVQ